MPLLERPLSAVDAEALVGLLAAAEKIDRTGHHFDLADCRDLLTDPELDYTADSVGVRDGAQLAGYQLTRPKPGTNGVGNALGSMAVVHPAYRGRGIGTSLVERGLRRASGLGARLQMRVPEADTAAAGLAERHGLTPSRWWSDLVRDLTAPVSPVAMPDGVEVQALGPGHWAERWSEPLRLANNAAFADHWGSNPMSAAAFRHMLATANFRPEHSVVATVGDVVVAEVLAEEFVAVTEQSGVRDLYVGTVATVREWRGRGLASALLARVLEGAAAAGYATSSLVVDAANPTGALGVYERAGYVKVRQAVTYVGP